MTYQDFFRAVVSRLQHGIAFNIAVETWRHASGNTETRWKLFIAFTEPRIFDGLTPEEVLSRFDNGLSDGQTLEQTSAAVGSVEVG